AQSALILINKLLEQFDVHVLVTSGTVTSAQLLEKRLPNKAMHQFMPLDQPKWCKRFLNYWKPDAALWIESELWPNMLRLTKKKKTPIILINARLSDVSFRRWSFFKSAAEKILKNFKLVLTQTERDQSRFEKLGAKKVIVTGNIKHSAAPLPYDESDLSELENALKNRSVWVYASTHDGEEELAARIHKKLKTDLPDLLTIIIPRHPERREDIKRKLNDDELDIGFRGDDKLQPNAETDIYIADTLGELGLFYHLSDIALIGRSFSHDGGGGHNPIEAAQLDCAVLTGPNIQFQQDLFNDMIADNAITRVTSEEELQKELHMLLTSKETREQQKKNAMKYAQKQTGIIDGVMEKIDPLLRKALK
ncbi:MAG: 3-deoxy-D-manno-octulosonic acid transferase, partial [Pseudomonadota bacterium]